jgi:outer membrane protein assembly factor BamB
VNKKGGLYPSANRGIRYIPGSSFGTRKSYGDLLVVAGGQVYVGTDNGHDVITVLSAEDGSYVKTIDVGETLVSMAVVGDRLAVATDAGLHLLDVAR